MEISEFKSFKFLFKFDQSMYNFEVVASSQEEAGEKLKKILTNILADVQVNFPSAPETPKVSKK